MTCVPRFLTEFALWRMIFNHIIETYAQGRYFTTDTTLSKNTVARPRSAVRYLWRTLVSVSPDVLTVHL